MHFVCLWLDKFHAQKWQNLVMCKFRIKNMVTIWNTKVMSVIAALLLRNTYMKYCIVPLHAILLPSNGKAWLNSKNIVKANFFKLALKWLSIFIYLSKFKELTQFMKTISRGCSSSTTQGFQRCCQLKEFLNFCFRAAYCPTNCMKNCIWSHQADTDKWSDLVEITIDGP